MHPEDRFAHIATSLPGVPREFCESYGWGEADEDQGTVEPFVSFEE